MPGTPCICALRYINSTVSSAVRQFAGFELDKDLNVLKRNKDLKSGDFIVFVPSCRKPAIDDTDVSGKNKDKEKSCLAEANKSCAFCPLINNEKIPVTVETLCEVEKGKLFVKLARPSVFKGIMKQMLTDKESICDHCTSVRNGSALINSSVLTDAGEDNAGSWDQLTLDQLRLLIVSEHVGNLLQKTGFSVTNGQYPAAEIVKKILNKFSGIDVKPRALEKCSGSNFDRTKVGINPAESFSIVDKFRKSPYALKVSDNDSEICSVPLTNDENSETSIVLDLKKFVFDNFSSSEKLPSPYQKNFNKVRLDSNSPLISQVYHIEQQRIRLEKLAEEKQSVGQSESQDVKLCVHVTRHEQEFFLQQTIAAWQILEPKVLHIKQVLVTCGPVSSRKGAEPLTVAQDFFRLRHQQTQDAFTMKYGSGLQGEGWKDNIIRLTEASIKFELLSTVCHQQVKLDLSVDMLSGGPVDNKGGVFVMYNFARLSTLFQHFEEAVAQGTYPGLPDIDVVDFSTLRQEEEWGLMFNFVFLYPSLLRDTVAGLELSSGPIHTHKICQFLLSLSNNLSSYYSKTHILCEPRPHLMPIMFARLYLMKSIREVMQECLALLGINPCNQM